VSGTTAERRRELIAGLFPDRVPRLWCPLLTHYTSDGGIDRARMASHLGYVSRWVKGYLIPGSTGDGWELPAAESREVLDFAVQRARQSNLRLLAGVLKLDAEAARKEITRIAASLGGSMAQSHARSQARHEPVCGYVVCPPTGRDLSQREIRAALTGVLELNHPTALYQLPQVTQNEISPYTAARLAARFPNFFLLKDSSGADRLAQSAPRLGGVFLVRGAEGHYAQWLRENGGPYDGLLLSTANCFPRELHTIIAHSEQGETAEAEAISRRLTSLIASAFELVSDIPDGNPFTNANKAMDHFFAHGPKAAHVPAPRLHSGALLPETVIRETERVLHRHGLMPSKGYLD
jgi:dihydrodipicolinate synthase/N-acetylneuraminate lyase